MQSIHLNKLISIGLIAFSTLGLYTRHTLGSNPLKPIDLLIIDPVNSESGLFCQHLCQSLPDGSNVQKSNLGTLEQALNNHWDLIILVRPDLANYSPEIARKLTLALDNKIGLMILGMPKSEASVKKVFQIGNGRVPATLSAHFASHFENSFWIWTPGWPQPNSTVYFRKQFQLDEIPSNAHLEITTDNQEKVYLNSQLLGQSHDWETPTTYDVTDDLKIGQNVLCVEAFNESGPAGLQAFLGGHTPEGRSLLNIPSDQSWLCTTQKPKNWHKPNADTTGWTNAAQIGDINYPTWQGRLQSNRQKLEKSITTTQANHPILKGINHNLGVTIVADALIPKSNAIPLLKADQLTIAVASNPNQPRTLIISVRPEHRTTPNDQTDLLHSQPFAQFFLQALHWLAGQDNLTQQPKIKTPFQELPPIAKSDIPKISNQNKFTAATGLLPIPYPHVHGAREMPRSRRVLRAAVDQIAQQGFSCLMMPSNLPTPLADDIAAYAQQIGLQIIYWGNGGELFHREVKDGFPAYSPEYPQAVRDNAKDLLDIFAQFPNLHTGFVYMDEPFYAGPQSFPYDQHTKNEFKKRFGYDLPNLDAIRNDPKRFWDVIDFRTDYFPDAWRHVYKTFKQQRPDLPIAITHDSHVPFGAGVDQHEILAINDVFHWGTDFADVFVFDIYPYMLGDFRYGQNATLQKPRIAQTRYAMAHMRNLTRTYGKIFGFWFEPYNTYWFQPHPEHQDKSWMEREMIFTALANDADYLLAGYGIPTDYNHWQELGKGLNTIQKAAPKLNQTKKSKAKAAFLFPRSQYIQLQEEYWNVAMSFELFTRAFGELDLIHEEQITDPTINGYDILVMCDIKLLPDATAKHIAQFVKQGGTLIADCVPTLNRYKQPSNIMTTLFGVTNPNQNRINSQAPIASQTITTDQLNDCAFNTTYNVKLTSPRPCTVESAQTLLKTQANQPALTTNKVGSGQTYLLGFCLQDTCFDTWKTNNPNARAQLRQLLLAVTNHAGVTAHVRSSNPDIEAALRTAPNTAFLILINHETETPDTQIQLADLPFTVKQIIDIETNKAQKFHTQNQTIHINQSLTLGQTRLLELIP